MLYRGRRKKREKKREVVGKRRERRWGDICNITDGSRVLLFPEPSVQEEANRRLAL